MGINHQAMKQLSFEKIQKSKLSFGGSLLKGNPKTKRPIHSKFPMLLTLRAERSTLRLPGNFKITEDQIYWCAKRYGVRVYSYANVGNHIHIIIRVSKRMLWSAFIRELTGRISQLTKTKWKFRPHTLIVKGWRRAYATVHNYVYLNKLEGDGLINREEVRTLGDLKAIFDG